MKVIVKEGSKFWQEKELPFYEIAPRDPDGLQKGKDFLAKRTFPRKELVQILSEYNRSIENRVELKELTHAVVTGQQLGLMGGPAYTILKGISCLQLARASGATPIFWLATEDHDVSEINHTYLLDRHGNFDKFRLNLPRNGKMVEDLPFSKHSINEMNRFLKEVKVDFEPSGSYSQTMARFLVKLFQGTGMVFLEPKILRPLAAPFFHREIEESDQIQKVLKQAGEELGDAPFGGNTTNLFIKDESGIRLKLEKENGEYFVKDRRMTKEELLQLDPSFFSPNGAARAVLQSLLIPTVAYIAGPGELSYYRQLKDYHRYHGIQMPWIVPRVQATFIPKAIGSKTAPWEPLQANAPPILKHLFRPYGKMQERVINFCYFQCPVKTVLKNLDCSLEGHHYCFLEEDDTAGW
jgi:bacillithiol biosynthesis cysteine-adding enzyme BshC